MVYNTFPPWTSENAPILSVLSLLEKWHSSIMFVLQKVTFSMEGKIVLHIVSLWIHKGQADFASSIARQVKTKKIDIITFSTRFLLRAKTNFQ